MIIIGKCQVTRMVLLNGRKATRTEARGYVDVQKYLLVAGEGVVGQEAYKFANVAASSVARISGRMIDYPEWKRESIRLYHR